MAEYYIEFDLMDGHNPGTGAPLSRAVLGPTPWRSIGSPTGGRFPNRTGKTLRAIRLTTNNGANRFRIDARSMGRLFDAASYKTDGSEVLFTGANIPDQTAFWMRVPANTPLEIQQCDQEESCPFTGQCFENDPAKPTGPEWVELRRAPQPSDVRWDAVRAATPSEFRDVQVASGFNDTGQVLFISKGELFLYSPSGKVEAMTGPDGTLAPINRIGLEGGEFTLWHDGVRRGSIKPPRG